jgi:fumarate reductase flavoprotein subunit
LNIDAITGATNTSNAILNAVADAVNQAGGDAEALKKVEVAANEAAGENAALAQTDGIFYMVCDKNNAGVGEDGITYGGQNIQDLIDAGLVVKADTLEELAELIDVDPATFVETIEKFNEAVKTGVDPEFNRASFGGDFINPDGNPGIFEPPFYTGPRTPSAHITKGGLKVNTSAEVIGTDGNAIPGLYAAGEVTGGRTVAGLLEAMTSGRTAGKTIMGK